MVVSYNDPFVDFTRGHVALVAQLDAEIPDVDVSNVVYGLERVSVEERRGKTHLS